MKSLCGCYDQENKRCHMLKEDVMCPNWEKCEKGNFNPVIEVEE